VTAAVIVGGLGSVFTVKEESILVFAIFTVKVYGVLESKPEYNPLLRPMISLKDLLPKFTTEPPPDRSTTYVRS